MGKKASHAGQECMSSSREMVLGSEDTLEEEEPDERERLDVCETFFFCDWLSKLEEQWL